MTGGYRGPVPAVPWLMDSRKGRLDIREPHFRPSRQSYRDQDDVPYKVSSVKYVQTTYSFIPSLKG